MFLSHIQLPGLIYYGCNPLIRVFSLVLTPRCTRLALLSQILIPSHFPKSPQLTLITPGLVITFDSLRQAAVPQPSGYLKSTCSIAARPFVQKEFCKRKTKLPIASIMLALYAIRPKRQRTQGQDTN